MKVLIIGGTSSLGRALKPVLTGFSEIITAGRKDCDITIDLNDPPEKIIIPDHVDTIIHTAADFGGKSAKEILDAESVNVLGTLKLCQAAVQAKSKHFIFISSIYAGLNENAAQHSIYALSKKHAEEVAKFYCSAHALPLTILRPSPIYGNDDSFRRHQPFFYTILDKAANGEDVTLYGSHDPLRNYIHIDDLTNIIAKVVQNKITGTYPCTQTTDVTYSQIARTALTAFNSKGSVHFLKDKPDIPDNIFEKDDTLYKKINFYPAISMEEGIKLIAGEQKKF
jgi:nucleoside-diphosphate-sugar epimerase